MKWNVWSSDNYTKTILHPLPLPHSLSAFCTNTGLSQSVRVSSMTLDLLLQWQVCHAKKKKKKKKKSKADLTTVLHIRELPHLHMKLAVWFSFPTTNNKNPMIPSRSLVSIYNYSFNPDQICYYNGRYAMPCQKKKKKKKKPRQT